jgi:acylphosphatase
MIVNAIIEWCRQGPQMARVDHVAIEWLDTVAGFSTFEIRA